MKWVNHQILTGVIVYAATGNLLYTACSIGGSILPDKLEGDPAKGNYQRWRRQHRGRTHWPLPYVLLAGFLYQAGALHLASPAMRDLAWFGIYILAGAVLHILEDAVCGKVPLLFPNKKWGISLFKVGSLTEYIFTLLVALCIWQNV